MTTLPDLLELFHTAKRRYSSIGARVRESGVQADGQIHEVRLNSPDDADRMLRRMQSSFQHWHQCAFDPNVIIPELWLEVVRETTVAGRSGIRVRGTMRRTTHDYFVLPGWGGEWDIVADTERGILLRLAHVVDSEEVLAFEILEIEFDRPG